MQERKKHPGGRPSKYKEEYCQEIIDFFTYDPVREVQIPHYKNGKLCWTDIKYLPNHPRFLIDFAHKIKINIDTLHEWARKHPEFSEAFTHAKRLNEMTLARGMTMGIYNPAATTFVLKNITNGRWKDRQEIDHNVKVNKIEVRFVDGDSNKEEN